MAGDSLPNECPGCAGQERRLVAGRRLAAGAGSAPRKIGNLKKLSALAGREAGFGSRCCAPGALWRTAAGRGMVRIVTETRARRRRSSECLKEPRHGCAAGERAAPLQLLRRLPPARPAHLRHAVPRLLRAVDARDSTKIGMRRSFPAPAATLARGQMRISEVPRGRRFSKLLSERDLRTCDYRQKWLFASSFVVFVTRFVVVRTFLVVPATLSVVARSRLDVAAKSWRDRSPGRRP